MQDKQADAIGVAVRQVIAEAQRLGLTWILRPATVLDTSNVRYDGDDEETDSRVTNLLESPLFVNQRVMCAIVPPAGNFVIGMLGGGRGLAAESYRDTTVGTFTTTETVIQFVTFTAIFGMTYEVTAVQSYQSSVKDDLVQIRLRWITGDTLTVAGSTEILSTTPNVDTAGRGNPAVLNATFAPGAGQVSVGVTAVRAGGTGNVQMFGSAGQQNSLIVKAI